MSALEPPKASTEPRGLPSGLLRRRNLDGGTTGYVDVGEEVRSELAATTFVALASVVALAGGGAALAAQWLPTAEVAVVVAAGSVLVSLAALGRAYFLCRAIPPARIDSGSGHEPPTDQDVDQDQAPSLWEKETESTPVSAPSPASSTDSAEPASEPDTGLGVRNEVFSRLAYRLQSLVNRLIHRIDRVEQEIEDPELLKSLYAIDHLATRIRRQVENLAVLGGEAPQRRSDIPVEANAVLRAAVAEIEHYTQVTTVPIREARIHGHVVAEIVHLLAELLENATTFTTPEAPKVMLRAHPVTAGLAIQVQDRGIGLSREDLTRINRLLDDSTRIDVGQLLEDGRIGLAVVKILAQRHGIGAELQPNIFGGTDTSVVIPHDLLTRTEIQDSTPRERPQISAGLPHASPSAPPSRPDESPRPSALPPTATKPPSRSPGAAPRQPWSQPHAPGNERSHHTPPHPSPTTQHTPARAEGRTPESTVGDLFPDEPAPHRGHEQRHSDQGAPGALPVRRRGESISRLRSEGNDSTVTHEDADRTADHGMHARHHSTASSNRSERPELPQRRGSHMPAELREPPEPTRSLPGHNPTLMASILEGRGRAEQAPPENQEVDPSQASQHPHTRNTEGDSTSWPT